MAVPAPAKIAPPACFSRLSPTPPIHKNAISGHPFFTCDATGRPVGARVGLPHGLVRAKPATGNEDYSVLYGAFADWNTVGAYLDHYRKDIGEDAFDKATLWVRMQAINNLEGGRSAGEFKHAPPLSLLALHGGTMTLAQWEELYVPFKGAPIYADTDAEERKERAEHKPPRQPRKPTLGDHVVKAAASDEFVTHLETYVWPRLDMSATRVVGIREGDEMVAEMAGAADVPLTAAGYEIQSGAWTFTQPNTWSRTQEAYRRKLRGEVGGGRKRKLETDARQVAAREKKIEEVRAQYAAVSTEAKKMRKKANAHASVLKAAGLLRPSELGGGQ